MHRAGGPHSGGGGMVTLERRRISDDNGFTKTETRTTANGVTRFDVQTQLLVRPPGGGGSDGPSPISASSSSSIGEGGGGGLHDNDDEHPNGWLIDWFVVGLEDSGESRLSQQQRTISIKIESEANVVRTTHVYISGRELRFFFFFSGCNCDCDQRQW